MSAYICEKNVFVYLISAAVSRRLSGRGNSAFRYCFNSLASEIRAGDRDSLASVANVLYGENVKSVSARYPNDKSSATLPGPISAQAITERDFGPRVLWTDFDPVQVLATIACLSYQSCEHSEWEKSEAFAILEAIKDRAIRALVGYDDAVWGAPEPIQAKVMRLV